MNEIICIVCPNGCRLTVSDDGEKVTGAQCPRGIVYGKKEVTNPTRVVTSTVRIKGAIHSRLPVKTHGDIDKKLIFKAMRLLDDVEVQHPVKRGDVILPNVLGTGVDIIASRDM